MSDAGFLAWRYLVWNRWRSLVLVLALAAAVVLPLGFRVVAANFRTELVRRATAAPWVVGERGSSVELVLHGLYFEAYEGRATAQGEFDRAGVREAGESVPLYIAHRAAGAPVVGTTLEYFEQMKLEIAQGRRFGRLGDAVLGAAVAQRLGLSVGDAVLTDSENRLNLAGAYPLKLRIVGVAAWNGSADDEAVFVDLRTAWVVSGIGHGHADVDPQDPQQVLERRGNEVVASAAVTPYTEITEENVNSFHFHGEPSDFPLTAMLVWPEDRRAEDLLRGRFVGAEGRLQLASSRDAIERLIASVVKVQILLDAAGVFLVVISLAFLSLVVWLSYQLRATERMTLHRIGCSRSMVWRMQVAELAMIGIAAVALAGLTLLMMQVAGVSLPRQWWV